jgi:hypothetical protein
VEGAKQSGEAGPKRKRSPEEPGPQGNACIVPIGHLIPRIDVTDEGFNKSVTGLAV